MPAKTQDIKEILNRTDNLYEAAMVIAKRARQINEELYQKKRDRQILEELEGGYEEDLLQMEHEEKEPEEQYLEDENPVVMAIEEFYQDKLSFHYETQRR
ncbi:MAG: DNA-directed RNA polymerase subunit omega [Calditrichaeota bacterium]|nr:MAG: DNA-directed RNA polymerase subunit omega [Calditrichota bacterium]